MESMPCHTMCLYRRPQELSTPAAFLKLLLFMGGGIFMFVFPAL